MITKNLDYIGRAYLKVRYSRDEGMFQEEYKNGEKNPMATRRIHSHLMYIGYRSREQDRDSDTYGLFDKESDEASPKLFYEKIYNDPALRHPDTIKMHKMIIGFHRDWYDKYQVEYKELVRHVMKSLEDRKGMKLEWVAAEHLKETSPHSHIAIKSTGEDEHGNTKRLKITKEDIEWLREEVDRYTGREQILSRDRELENDKSLSHDILKELTKGIERQAKEGEIKNQQARAKAEREQKANDRERGRDR